MYNKRILTELSALANEWDNFNSTLKIPSTSNVVIKIKHLSGEYNVLEVTNSFHMGLRCYIDKLCMWVDENLICDESLERLYIYLQTEFNKPRQFQVMADNESREFWFEGMNQVKYALPRKFTNRIDLENKVFYFGDSKEHLDLPTLSDLIQRGILSECFDYKKSEYSYCGSPKRISIKTIQSFFRKHGFNVTEEAILHNFNAYHNHLKSGYRDEKNGYHLFTPSNLNPLSFRVTSLSKHTDWQTTYEI